VIPWLRRLRPSDNDADQVIVTFIVLSLIFIFAGVYFVKAGPKKIDLKKIIEKQAKNQS
jgi:hypothetical protein